MFKIHSITVVIQSSIEKNNKILFRPFIKSLFLQGIKK